MDQTKTFQPVGPKTYMTLKSYLNLVLCLTNNNTILLIIRNIQERLTDNSQGLGIYLQKTKQAQVMRLKNYLLRILYYAVP